MGVGPTSANIRYEKTPPIKRSILSKQQTAAPKAKMGAGRGERSIDSHNNFKVPRSIHKDKSTPAPTNTHPPTRSNIEGSDKTIVEADAEVDADADVDAEVDAYVENIDQWQDKQHANESQLDCGFKRERFDGSATGLPTAGYQPKIPQQQQQQQ
ncbi:hypothetical protein ACLKA6_015453 [Drosophila palustris]